MVLHKEQGPEGRLVDALGSSEVLDVLVEGAVEGEVLASDGEQGLVEGEVALSAAPLA